MRLRDEIVNCACFLAYKEAKPRYGGTAFVVAMRGIHDNAHLYLVTAKHVAEKLEDCPFVIGFNSKDGRKAVMDADGVKWYYHPTEPNAVDAAATPFATAQYESLDLELIAEHQFATPEVMREACIGIGDEIVAIGLFTRFSGTNQHFPIVRTGNLAMLPGERIPVKGFEPMEACLVEGRSIGGLSGSPVWVRQTVNFGMKDDKGNFFPFSGLGQGYFLGLMHGHWEVPATFENTEGAEAVNMGVSIVVPARKILEVINHPELVAMRKKNDEAITATRGPVADTAFGEKPEAQTTAKGFEIPVPTQEQFLADLTKASRKLKPE